MDKSSELSKLIKEVRFTERFRGYDYVEVDKYVSAVSRAAANAQTLIAELRDRADKAEAALSQENTKGPGDDAESAKMRETLLNTLVSAQHIADTLKDEADKEASAVVNKARGRAEEALTSAEAKSASMLREAEQRSTAMIEHAQADARRIVEGAKRIAAEETSVIHAKALTELGVVKSARAELLSQIADLQAQRADQRRQLIEMLNSLQDFVVETGLVAETGLHAKPTASTPVGVTAVPAEESAGQTSLAGNASAAHVDDLQDDDAEHSSSVEATADEEDEEHFGGETSQAEAENAQIGAALDSEDLKDAEHDEDSDKQVSSQGGLGSDAVTAVGTEGRPAAGDTEAADFEGTEDAGDAVRTDRSGSRSKAKAKAQSRSEAKADIEIPARPVTVDDAVSADGGAVEREVSGDAPAMRLRRSKPQFRVAESFSYSDAEEPKWRDDQGEPKPSDSRRKARSSDSHSGHAATQPMSLVTTEGHEPLPEDPSPDDPARHDEFVEQLRQVVSDDAPPPEAHDPLETFFEQDDRWSQEISWGKPRG